MDLRGDERVIKLAFAAALHQRVPEDGIRYCFVTPADALPRMGAPWAVDLQTAVEAWSSEAALMVDGDDAPGFSLKALELGLKRLRLGPDHPALADLERYAKTMGAEVSTGAFFTEEEWTPVVPTRKQKRTAKSGTNRPD